MKNINKLICFILIPLFSFCQDSNELITQIKTEFKRINTISKLEKIDLLNKEYMENIPDGGCQLTGFFENKKLVKIIEWIGSSHGTIVTELYLKDDKLFFIYINENKFKSIFDKDGNWMYLDSTKEETIFEGRYYFNDKKLIKQLNKGERLFGAVIGKEKLLEHTNSIAKILKNEKDRTKKN